MTKYQQLVAILALVAVLAWPAFEYMKRPGRARAIVWLSIAAILAVDYVLLYGDPSDVSLWLGLD